MLRKIFLIGFIGLTGMTCEKSDEIMCFPESTEFPLITIGRECGWCVGFDSLAISDAKLCYGFNNFCNDDDFFTQEETDPQKWNNLISSLDMDKFSKIDINSCYLCVDGCDTWISVKTENELHTIRFGYRDSSKIKPIQPFVDQLEGWIDEFRD